MCQHFFFFSMTGWGLCTVDWAMGQALWRGVTLSHDHPVHPWQLLLGQPGGQWLPTWKLPLAGCRWYFWAVELPNSAVKIPFLNPYYYFLPSTDCRERKSSSCADGGPHTPAPSDQASSLIYPHHMLFCPQQKGSLTPSRWTIARTTWTSELRL